MPAARLSVSVTSEMNLALRELARQRGEDISRLLETLLRENPLVQEKVRELRSRPPTPGTKKERDVEKLLLLARISGRLWEERVASGEVKLAGRK